MKNYKIQPRKISELVTTTVKSFEVMEGVICGNPQDYPKYMHFMADLLKDLVETAYPMEDKHEGGYFEGPIHEFITITETSPFSVEQFEKAMENISKIMKDHKPPKAGEF